MLCRSPRPRTPRPGFTLVELLVVIIIISLLVSLLVVAIGRARITALDARVTAEIAQLDSAVKAYKEKYGAYPPTMWDTSAAAASINTAKQATFVAHMRRTFPRAGFTTYSVFQTGLAGATNSSALSSPGYPNAAGLNPDTMEPAEALVFFLGGMPAQHNAAETTWGGSSKLDGFHLNPASPLSPGAAGQQRTAPFFDFDQSRLHDADDDGWLEYYPPNTTAPYVYFGSASYGAAPFTGSATFGMARPYTDASIAGGFMNGNTFQIIAAGQDHNYGADNVNKVFPTGTNYNNGDNDNLTNFVTTRLEDAQ